MNEASESEQEHNWETFTRWFSEFSSDFPFIPLYKAPQECAWKVGPSRIAVDRDFLRAAAPFNSAVEDAIRRICLEGAESTLPRLPPAVVYFVGLRVLIVELFLSAMSVTIRSSEKSEIHSTIIPFPMLSPLQVAEWFLLDWWREHGPERICEMQLLEETLPLQ